MTSENENILKNLAAFIYKGFERRDNVLYLN